MLQVLYTPCFLRSLIVSTGKCSNMFSTSETVILCTWNEFYIFFSKYIWQMKTSNEENIKVNILLISLDHKISPYYQETISSWTEQSLISCSPSTIVENYFG